MLTFLTLKANFPPLMQLKKIIMVFLLIVVLQSCYTMLYPPQTLPQTMTTVVSEPAMVSTIGGSGMYGWDPYWEPALPFTSYHTGYGASYYSPYNYYDYHHPHYAPVYVVSETRDPAPARGFDRDEKQGGSRVRERNNSSSPASSGNKGNTGSIGGGMSSAASPIINPTISDPVVIRAPIIKKSRNDDAKPIIKNVKPVKVNKPKPVKTSKPQAVKKQKKSEKSDPPPPKKRTRTRN
ncbi:MAG: hypothetical protein HOB84_10635 [Candidatus Marinimicrobia bacterium]|jgi:hypothetical protein|nr:hypothetical protein [Candidatus Neomarinimicrobiota bacterium]MBT4361346.1 hypothetical protein [Candidatus Neomarinimicrobiota bacterium]MBT4715218.1 hypothetical protein [Candidatus Neomarinimicrobiota bacterium]MBT4946858.1 hypothetical protein [Candidatus Neomarinimicrobiota bacterium]MBT5267843.1 hypothetical protein [Candidatus Neomarinimicrobiota bacterium]